MRYIKKNYMKILTLYNQAQWIILVKERRQVYTSILISLNSCKKHNNN